MESIGKESHLSVFVERKSIWLTYVKDDQFKRETSREDLEI